MITRSILATPRLRLGIVTHLAKARDTTSSA
jgi:hypothetical protein